MEVIKMKKILVVLIATMLVFSMFFGVSLNAKGDDLSNLSLSVQTDKRDYKLGENVKLTFTIENKSDAPIRLKFNTAKIYDFSIVNLNGRLVFMYSKGMKFAQVITYLDIPAHGKKTFTYVWNQRSNTGNSVTVGEYMVNFWLALPGLKGNVGQKGFVTTQFGIVGTVGMPFPDVVNIMQQNAIKDLYNKGLIKGYPDGTFKPNRTLTRAEATVLILRLIGITPSGHYTQTFTDVPSHFWAFKWIEEAYKRGIVKGIGNGQFAPQREVTRGEFTVMVVRELKLPVNTDENPYKDVTPAYFGYKEILTAYHYGILSGFDQESQGGSEKLFIPNKAITRGEAAIEMDNAYFVLNHKESFNPSFSIPQTFSENKFSAEEVSVSVSPSLPQYSVDVDKAENHVSLTPAETKFLEENGFVIQKSDYPTFEKFYSDNRGPIFISFDTYLQAYHTIFDLALRYDEVNYFIPDLDEFNKTLINTLGGELVSAPKALRTAIVRDLEFMAVGETLLNPDYTLPYWIPSAERDAMMDKVNAEIKLINAHQGFKVSPIFGYEEDYSQYVPRGHYTKTEQLKNYFKAMMWFGRMRFLLKPGVSEEEIAIGRSQTQSALALSLNIVSNPALLTLYDKIYEPTSFFVGKSDDLNFYDYIDIAKKVYGSAIHLSDLINTEKLDEFISDAINANHSQISTVGETRLEETMGFRLMGQRFTPDAYVFQNLVFPKAGNRMMPKALDLFYVFGNKTAKDILLNAYNEKTNQQYVQQVEGLSKQFPKYTLKEWLQNLYWGWLSLLKTYAKGSYGSGYPVFMQNGNWAKKELVTALASYTELKHDTILYAKQSYTTKSSMPIKIPGFVEPNVAGYTRMLTLLQMTEGGLTQRGLLPDELKAKIDQLKSLTKTALEISKKELEETPLSDSEKEFFAVFPDVTSGFFTFSPQFTKTLGGSDEKVALVADIHTDPNSGEVLEEGVGNVNTIFVFAPYDGKYYIFKGPVFSYYEFTEKMSNRLTDEKWQSMLESGQAPEMPFWEASLIP
jgi:hypothetical protein